MFDKIRHTPKVQIVKQTLKNRIKILNEIENKNVVLAHLNIQFRKLMKTDKLASNIYENFVVFTNIIRKCMLSEDKHFWNSWLPIDWNNLFYCGCVIIDDILNDTA